MIKFGVLANSVDHLLAGQLRDKSYFDIHLVTVGMMAAILMALILAAVMAAGQIVEAASVPTIRLQRTKAPPDLPLADGHRWHMFLSHTWSTGQDQCATIRRQLKIMLPGASVFLDVDDLKSIDGLEEYVAQSSVVMIFASKGYFQSKSKRQPHGTPALYSSGTLANTCTHATHADCLREVQATVDQKKPLCIVVDPVRGGAPLHEIEAECAAHLHQAIFGGGARPKRGIITWHRIKDFQLVSIKLLAEQLLIGCLRDRSLLGGPDRALFVPGELQRQKLVLNRRVVVYASPHNPGALAVAKDIASAMDNQIKVTSDPEVMTIATHFLLYLTDQTYLHAAGVKLAEELRRARAAGSTIEVLMVHENDAKRGGCEFSIFFDGRTPTDLMQGGIYDVRVPRCYIPSALCRSPSCMSFSSYAYLPGSRARALF